MAAAGGPGALVRATGSKASAEGGSSLSLLPALASGEGAKLAKVPQAQGTPLPPRGPLVCAGSRVCSASWRTTPVSAWRPALQSRSQARVPKCPFEPGACHAGAASSGCAPSGRSQWRMSWSGGCAGPGRGEGAGPGGVRGPKGAGGPGAAPSLACASSGTPARSELPRGLPGGPLGGSPLRLFTAPHFGRRSSVAFVEAETRVWPQGRAGQGRNTSTPLTGAAFLGSLKGTWPRVKEIRGMWPAFRGSRIPRPIAL